MSKVTDVYNGLLTNLDQLFPSPKLRIPNPYSLPDNGAQFLGDSWGLKVGSSSPYEFDSCTFGVIQLFSVVVSHEYFATESDTQIEDDTSLKLLEDVYKVQKRFLSPDRMNIDSIANVEFSGCTEIQNALVNKRKFLSREISFLISIRESL